MSRTYQGVKVSRNMDCPCGSGKKFKRCHGYYPEYVPNHVHLLERILLVFVSLFILIYGAMGLYLGVLILPGKYGLGAIKLYGLSAITMTVAMFFSALNLMSVVVDHYDRRDNESSYRMFATITRLLGWIFFASTFVVLLGFPQLGWIE